MSIARPTILVIGLLFLAVASSPAQEPEVEYDKFTDTTTVTVHGPEWRSHARAGEFGFQADYTCSGDRLCIPDYIDLKFISVQDDWTYLNSHDVIFLLDDSVRIRPRTADHNGTTMGGGAVLEAIGARIGPDDFERFAEATRVEYKIGPTTGELGSDQLEALHALFQKIEQADSLASPSDSSRGS